MKLLFTLVSAVMARRVDINAHHTNTNPVATGRFVLTDFDQFVTDGGRMTSWTGATTITIEHRRKLFLTPWFNIHEGTNKSKGDEPMVTYKSWWNPIANSRRSIRNKEGQTINRIHFNQWRRAKARMRAFLTTPGTRKETYYTVSYLGKKLGGQKKETVETGHKFNKFRTNAYNMAKGKCNGKMDNVGCKGRVYTAVAWNHGYKFEVFKGDTIVALAELNKDYLEQKRSKWLIGEKKHWTVKIEDGQDNLALTEFITYISEMEAYLAVIPFR